MNFRGELDKILERVPIGRAAIAVAFLASDASSYITVSRRSIAIDGGLTIR